MWEVIISRLYGNCTNLTSVLRTLGMDDLFGHIFGGGGGGGGHMFGGGGGGGGGPGGLFSK